MNNEDEPPQLENCYIKLTKLKNIRSTMNNFPITATVDDGGVVDLANIISDSCSGRSKANDFAPTTTTAAAIGTGGINGRGGAGCGYTMVNPNGGNDANSNTMFNGNSSIINSSVSNTSNHGSSFGVFDDDFYENVSSNVNINLCCYLDGKLQTTLTNTLSPTGVASPTEPALRSIVVKSPVATDSKIYEATNLPALGVMFPTLLTFEQYGTDSLAGQAALSTSAVKTKKPITKNSWKWKWDFVKKYKYVNENGRIVKKIKQPTLGLRDLSKLDMWTQLTMRTKHEEIHRRSSPDDAHDQPQGETDALLRKNKQAMVDQLNQILDARLLPQIDLEQNDQRIIKVEQVDEQSLAEITEQTLSKHSELTSLGLETKRITPENVAPAFLVSLANGRRTDDCVSSSNMISETDFLQGLKLMQLVRHNNLLPVVLSGEWARPRCYICYGCGDKFNSLKQVEEHRIFRHPHVYSMFYEIVGRELIEKRLYKHFFIPLTALAAHRLHYLRLAEAEPDTERFDPTTDGTFGLNIEIKNEDSSSNEATSVSTTTSAALASSSRSSISSSSITTLATLMDASGDCVTSLTRYPPTLAEDEGDSRTVVCSKCQKECQNMLILYAHMLHCSNDYVWLQAKKRMKYRRARRRRGGNRNTSSAVAGFSCAASLLATVRKAQQQHLQNSVEKSETASTTSTSSSKEGGASLSRDVTNSSNTSSCSTSNSSIGSSSQSPSKKSKSPKPKDSDSDIVKRLLANLPAKRNSRQIILQTTKKTSKRSNVKGRTPLVASSKVAKAAVMKCRKTLGTAVATRISVTKDNKKAKMSSRLAAGSGASRNEDTPGPIEASSGAALSGTPLSSRNLRSTS
uniref:C2H2-type domain-containing protein n=1 Tax=Anopheles atroparvus TaxID=41427 RepID=A0AAG5DG15_ANOAO